MQLPTDTAHVNIESRQYSLMGADLGEGFVRRNMMVAVALYLPWAVFLAILGASIVTVPWLYLIPPGILTFLAVRKDKGERPYYVTGLDAVRYLRRRRQPVLPRPARRPYVLRPQFTVATTTTEGTRK